MIMRNSIILLLAVWLVSCSQGGELGKAVDQVAIPRVEIMPNMPQPYKILDWKKKALDFDAYAFDFNSKLPAGTMIWLDNSQRNLPQQTFGLYTAIHDVRQGAKANRGEFHESLNTMAAVLGAGLVGVDKTNQGGYNFVKMLQNYYNTDNGWGIMMNNTCPEVALLGGGYGRDWWYDLLPNALFYAVSDVFPDVEGADDILHKIAEKFVAADSVLNGNYDYSFFDYGKMQGVVNQIPLQQDAAGGHAYVLYLAYRKFGDPRYLEHAMSALKALDGQKESRFYEILLPLGAYTAAAINAEHGTNYDVLKMLNWVFDGCTDPKARYGWGVIAERWGDYDVYGLQGSITDGGGYAFLMNSIKLAWPFVPMVKYQPQYARAIGKWMLNNVNACRLFFPTEIPDQNQWLPQMKGVTQGIVAYEGLRKADDYGNPALKGISPVALGDGPKWNPKNPPESMFSLYSTSPIGMFGAMVKSTNVEGILMLDCNTTDFYNREGLPTQLIYNPYKEEKRIRYTPMAKSDLIDIVSKSYLAKGVDEATEIAVPADNALIVVEVPAGTPLEAKGNKLVAGNKMVAYQ